MRCIKIVYNPSYEALFEAENKRVAEERKQFPILADPAFWGPSGKGLGEWDNELFKYQKKDPRYPYGRPVSDIIYVTDFPEEAEG